MADRADKDNRQGPFTRVIQKHAARAKERILQNLGKADRTTDVDFDLCVKNFSKQQAAVTKLHKEFKNYHQCLKAMQIARKSLMDTVCELYEPCWAGLDQFLIKSEVLNQNFEDFSEKINNQILTPVSSYISQFPDLNNRIAKRNRKLLDFDNCRHNLQNLETMKKREEAKIVKAKEQLEEAQNLFEVINSELHDELPALYDSRVTFFVSHLQSLYLAEVNFHTEDASLFMELNTILETLNEASKTAAIQRSKSSESHVIPCEKEGSEIVKHDSAEEKEDESSSGSPSGSGHFFTPQLLSEINGAGTDEVLKEENVEKVVTDVPQPECRILYKVRGTYEYKADDNDELSFNVGDIIDVIAYDDPEEQEEGWLMGVFNGKKGLFPANFTSRI